MKVTNEMSPVRQCGVTNCAYNVTRSCHAKAITVGDSDNPGCDTFFEHKGHNRETLRIAGVGACKVASCKFNDDFECTAESINIGRAGIGANCLTYARR